MSDSTRPTVTEQTNKRWKGLQAVGCLTVVVSMIAVGLAIGSSTGDEPPAAAMVFGFLIFAGAVAWLVGRLGAWWFHA